jgi:hypothetical protein
MNIKNSRKGVYSPFSASVYRFIDNDINDYSENDFEIFLKLRSRKTGKSGEKNQHSQIL